MGENATDRIFFDNLGSKNYPGVVNKLGILQSVEWNIHRAVGQSDRRLFSGYRVNRKRLYELTDLAGDRFSFSV
ncbi:hypothetical protein [Arthrospira platensis]|uniref:hypothetical protein n=1 Tax=Limnospira TaxID=2596745 RepID=UPI0001D0E683|nr:hypothetical protein [Arthrospira platensis]MBD2671116.1 hypothetical protein [Arthrospira platensis FACHB-439]MBD2711896.1 hypothetical protein [Arthrospira platensis FACHB-835]MDF2212979.1 hypothetical protein [Arthrospira platensis NCB002]MDT9184470.1 hypothetical protein [Limnospira sp. PMC 289.06]MDT9312236.1 hypothetical protein [Limnospira sp. Paracas R14]QQW27002.1 hypothetical protein AP9108_16715 [Arthrospira sp. PCC 9108]BAI91307.1 hypothetical protein NIES39_J02600 [Arthrospir